MASLKNTTVAGTDSVQLAVGTTAQRPGSPVTGDLRFNSTFKVVEYYDGSQWKYLPPVVEDGLVLRLDAAEPDSYPGTGTLWYDLSPENDNANLNNGPVYSSADGGSIDFDGTNDYVGIGNQLDPVADGLFAATGTSWSVSSWFKDNVGAGQQGAITGKSGGLGSVATYVVWVDDNILKVRLRGGTITFIETSLTETWHEVVITWDGTTARAYLDGVFETTIPVGTAANQTVNFTIGAANNGNTAFFNGNISDVKVYNRALLASEIQQNFNALRGRYGV